MLSSQHTGDRMLGDTPTKIVEEDKMAGMVEESKVDRLRSQRSSIRTLVLDAPLVRFQKPKEQVVEETQDDEEFKEIVGFNEGRREPGLEDYVRDGEIFEQGIVRIAGTLYMATLCFKKIESNFENMKALIEDRLKIKPPKSLSH